MKRSFSCYLSSRDSRMGQGGSRAGRLTKEDVMFLKANTRYDEDTIQVPVTSSDLTKLPSSLGTIAGVVQGFHLRLPQRKAHSRRLCEDLQPVLPKWQCKGLLRPHLQDVRHGWERLHWLQRVSSCHRHHFKWNSRGEAGLGFQVRRNLVFRGASRLNNP